MNPKPPQEESSLPSEHQMDLSAIVDTHASLEAQVGAIYIALATQFADNLELYRLWSAMALDEGGHAALLRAISKGLLTGMLQAKPNLLPLDSYDALQEQIETYRQQVQAGVTLDQALRLSWDLETSELDFLYQLLISSSHLAALGIPTNLENNDTHAARLRHIILRYTTDDNLRREVKLLESAGGLGT